MGVRNFSPLALGGGVRRAAELLGSSG